MAHPSCLSMNADLRFKLCIGGTTERRQIMKISRFLKRSLIGSLIVMLVPFGALSQQIATSGEAFSRAELDQMLAPIALYPDELLDQILAAASFPDQIAEADRWVKRNANLAKARLSAAMNTMAWDSSVKALAAFPTDTRHDGWAVGVDRQVGRSLLGSGRRCDGVHSKTPLASIRQGLSQDDLRTAGGCRRGYYRNWAGQS